MGWHRKVLVVANVTADSGDLLGALKERAERDELTVTLLVPALGPGGDGRKAAEERMTAAVEGMRAAGLDADGAIGDSDPVTAVAEVWDPRLFDDVIVCTLPGQWSRWLQFDLPHRVAKITGVPVMHVVAMDKAPQPAAEPSVPHEQHPLGPLSVLAWGGRRSEPDAA